MANELESNATYQLDNHHVVAGDVGRGWWLLHVKGTGPVDTWTTLTVAPDGRVYEGGVEFVPGKGGGFRPLGALTSFTKDDLLLVSENPYHKNQSEKRTQEDRPSAFRQMMNSLEAETSDRAIAIVGAAYLDDRLARTIRAFLIKRDEPTRKLLGTQGPLGAFGARIQMAFCLGLLDEDEYHDLGIIQKIRNEFAHQVADLTFDEARMAQRCDLLRLLKSNSSPELYQSYTRRKRYITTVADIIAALATAEFHATNERRTVPEPRPWRRYGKK